MGRSEEVFAMSCGWLVVIGVFVAFSEYLKVVTETGLSWRGPMVCKAMAELRVLLMNSIGIFV
jgi:hypothetical protein